ncbi:MAG: TonB-dependent receptor [Chitinophagaceae bacterium]|nr:TonB-dependent receptor [Chitinophagaceae bacterium]
MKANFLLRIRVLLFFLLFFSIARAQNRTVTGTVTSKVGGQPLAGATVSVKGTRVATTTDNNGNFRLSVPASANNLSISFVGMAAQEVSIPSSGTITIQLEQGSGAKMDEVVVVGYGTQKKSVVTGAISSVRASDLAEQPVTRIEQSLQGRTSGLTISSVSGQPGAASTVRLRGFTSIGATSGDASKYGANPKNDPLWVVDGVVVDNGGISYLNQDDIESIEVLKDGASAAIYGTRAAAGVILVTTKKGKNGRLNINYSGYYGIQRPEKKLKLADATQYATMRNMSVANGNEFTSTPKPVPFADPASLGKGTDWQKIIFDYSAPKMSHEFNVSGGTDKSSFFTSFGYTDIKGVVASPIAKWKRMNFRVNSQFKPAKFISFGENMGYSHSISSGVGETNREFSGIVSNALNLDPVTPVIVADTVAQAAFLPAAKYRPTVTRDPLGRYYAVSPYVANETKNPAAFIQNSKGNYNWDHNIVGNAFLDITPVKGLVIHSSFGTKVAFFGSETFTPTVYYNASNTGGPNNLKRVENWLVNWNVENTISYNKLFGQHNVTLLGGWGEYKDGNARGATIQYNNIPATNFDQASFIYNALPSDRTSSSGSDGTDHRVNSLFGRIQYNYAEKYLLTALVRRDGSSNFGANNKFGYFPSVSVGWVPTLENFFPQSNVLSNLKIRASYGVTGNDLLPPFAFVDIIGSGAQRNYTFGSGDNLTVGYSPLAPGNPNLKWEETRTTDIGVDAVLFNTLTLTVDVYKKKTTGILQNPVIPGYAGYYGSFFQNYDDMENTGLEIEAGYKKKIGELSLAVNGNISFYKNKITKMLPGQTFIEDPNNSSSFQNLGAINRTALGQAYGRFYGRQAIGIFQTQDEVNNYKGPKGTVLQPKARPGDTKYANINNDESIDDNDRVYLGNPNPTMSYGLTLNLGYKNFDFIVFGSGSGGNKIFQGYRRLDITASNYTTKYLDAWTPTHTNTKVPRLVDGDPNGNFSKMSSFYLENGTFFKFRTIQLGYTLPKTLVNKWGIQRLRVYALAENLININGYSGYDPEIGVSPDTGSGSAYGIDRGAYVQPRSFLFGLNVGF